MMTCEKKKKKVTDVKKMILFSMSAILSIACNNDKPFTREEWADTREGIYHLRKPLVSDLIQNHLKSDICYDELINLLGNPIKSGLLEKTNHMYYEVEIKGGWGPDDRWTKYLDIELNPDSCYLKAKIIKKGSSY